MLPLAMSQNFQPFLTAVKVWFHSRQKLVFSSLSFNPHLVSFCAACSTLLVQKKNKKQKTPAVLCLVLGKKKKNNKKDQKKFHLTLKETSLLKMHFLQWAKDITISEVYNRKRKNEQERERKVFFLNMGFIRQKISVLNDFLDVHNTAKCHASLVFGISGMVSMYQVQ